MEVPNARRSLLTGFRAALESRGVLEEPESAMIAGWWTPWLALATGAGGVYLTRPDVASGLGESFTMMPSYYESLDGDGAAAMAAQQRSALRSALSRQSIASLIEQLTPPPALT